MLSLQKLKKIMLESAEKYGNPNPEKVTGILEADSEVKQVILILYH